MRTVERSSTTKASATKQEISISSLRSHADNSTYMLLYDLASFACHHIPKPCTKTVVRITRMQHRPMNDEAQSAPAEKLVSDSDQDYVLKPNATLITT